MAEEPEQRVERDYVPAAPQLWLYDFLVAALTRESRWRSELIRQIDPGPGDSIADIGCGTGTLLARIGPVAPRLTLVGLDPDGEVLERARRKVRDAGVQVDFEVGYARDAARLLCDRQINKVVSSLVFHQVPMHEKRAGLEAMHEALIPGGELHMADYGLQRTPLMRRLYRIVGAGDGYENTEPNGRGVLPELMKEIGFQRVEERAVVPTPTGSISLYFATRAA